MKSRTLISVVAGLIAFGFAGTNLAGHKEKPTCPPAFQEFAIDAFTEDEALFLWPTGADAYATQQEAAVDFPDASLEAFVWSNIVVKDGFLEVLESVDRNGDGLICVKYKVLAHGSTARLYPDYDPLFIFYFLDPGQ